MKESFARARAPARAPGVGRIFASSEAPSSNIESRPRAPLGVPGNDFCAPWGEPGVQSSDKTLYHFITYAL
jgi:hypothetical protein